MSAQRWEDVMTMTRRMTRVSLADAVAAGLRGGAAEAVRMAGCRRRWLWLLIAAVGRMWTCAAACLMAVAAVCPAQVVINEFMASNATTLTNAQGETEDWIEIYNASGVATNLEGWYLTDRASDLRQWRFPSAPIGPYGYLLVFASGSGTAVIGSELHASFKLDADGEYLALVKPDGVTVASAYAPAYPPQATDVSFGLRPDTVKTMLVATGAVCRFTVPTSGADGTNWTAAGFDDSAWSSGPRAIGYESSPSNYAALIRSTVPVGTRGVYVRCSFVVAQTGTVDVLTMRLQYDDGVVAYLNGRAVLSDNAPLGAQWDSPSLTERESEEAVRLDEFDLTAWRGALVNGTNVLAIHALNGNLSPHLWTDLLLDAELDFGNLHPQPERGVAVLHPTDARRAQRDRRGGPGAAGGVQRWAGALRRAPGGDPLVAHAGRRFATRWMGPCPLTPSGCRTAPR